MNAITYIRQYSIKKARKVLSDAPIGAWKYISGWHHRYGDEVKEWGEYTPQYEIYHPMASNSNAGRFDAKMRQLECVDLFELKCIVESITLIEGIKSGLSYKFHPTTQTEYEQFKELLYSIDCMCQHDSYENIQTITIRRFNFNCYSTKDLSIGDCMEIGLVQLKQAITAYDALYREDVTNAN